MVASFADITDCELCFSFTKRKKINLFSTRKTKILRLEIRGVLSQQSCCLRSIELYLLPMEGCEEYGIGVGPSKRGTITFSELKIIMFVFI